MRAHINSTILLLISEPVVRRVFQEKLEDQGYLVLEAGDLGTATHRIQESKPDLLIIRTYVAEITGIDAAKYLRTKCPGLPVLMVVGLLDDDRLRDRMATRHIEVFPKPFPATELFEKVKEVLASAAARVG